MKQKIRLMAMLWPSLMHFAIRFLQFAMQRRFKRKQPNNPKKYNNSLTGKPGGKALGTAFHVCSTLRSAPRLRGLAMVLSCIGTLWLLPTQAQTAGTPDVKPLQIGDIIPEYLWHMPLQVVNHPEGRDTITLNDYRGKLIILDFWATWCPPCLKSLDRIDTLRQVFSTDVVFLPITSESKQAVVSMVQKRNWELPIVFGQDELSDFLPHRIIPHLVWIYNQKVGAVTEPDVLTAENMLSVLRDSTLSFPEKIDKEIDYFKPIVDYAQPEQINSVVQSIISAYVPGVGGMGIRERDGLMVQYFLNCAPLEMYRIVFGIGYESIKLDVDISADTEVDSAQEMLFGGKFCYQIIVPSAMPETERYRKVVCDLNAHFGINTVFEDREVDCYVIRQADSNKHCTKGATAEQKNSLTLSKFVKQLNHAGKAMKNMPLFVDESGLDIRIHKTFNPSELKYDIPLLQKILSSYCLTIEKSVRPHRFLVISKANNLSSP